MTNDTKRHARDLADVSERLSRRVSVYHALLVEALAELDSYSIEYDPVNDGTCRMCVTCGGQGETGFDHTTVIHTPDCLARRIEQALAADDDALAAMLAALGGEGER